MLPAPQLSRTDWSFLVRALVFGLVWGLGMGTWTSRALPVPNLCSQGQADGRTLSGPKSHLLSCVACPTGASARNMLCNLKSSFNIYRGPGNRYLICRFDSHTAPHPDACVTSGKFLNLSVPWFLFWPMWVLTVPYTERLNRRRVLSAGLGTESALNGSGHLTFPATL